MKKISLLLALTTFTFFTNAQVTLAFQGGETGDSWNFTSTGASSTALAGRTLPGNHVSGSSSLVVGGNSGGGSCLTGGSGNGPATNNVFTFDPIDISTSSNFTRTLSFNYGNYLPACNGTGWDTGDNLIFTPIIDGVAQTPVTLVSGSGDISLPIQNNTHSYTIPSCVMSFAFELSLTANRADEFLYLDNVSLKSTALNPTVPATSVITGNQTICLGGSETYSVDAITNASYTWSGLPAGASFTTPNSTTSSNAITIDWGTAVAGTYTIQVIPAFTNCTTQSNGTTSSLQVTLGGTSYLNMSPAVSICAGESTTISVTDAGNYAWNQDLGNGNSFTVTPSATTAYEATGTLNGCAATGSITVTVKSIPTVSVTPNASTVCAGTTQQLVASGATSFTWNASPSIQSTNGANVQILANATESFTVTGTTNGCSNTASATITVNPVLNVNAGTDFTVCSGESITLNATGANNYVWDNGLTQGQAFPITQTTTFNVIGSSTNACDGNDAITVTVINTPTLVLTADNTSICPGNTVNITASGADSYIWASSPSIATNTGTAISANPTSTENFNVSGTRNGCTSNASITINVSNGVNVNAGADFSICAGESVILSATGANQYTWNNGVAQGVPFIPTQTATYTVVGNDNSNCPGADQITVTVNPIPTATMTSDVQTGCLPLTVNFQAQTASGNTISWNLPSGTQTGLNTQATFTTSACADIVLTVSNSAGCSQDYSFPNYICPSPSPIANFTVNPNQLSKDASSIQLTNLSENATDYTWDFGDNSNLNTEFEPTYDYGGLNISGYWIHLTASNNLGCTDEASKFISVQLTDDLLYFVPNVFTPNGDEINQIFSPVFTSGFDPSDYHLIIFNRWGQIMFESHDPKLGWDGTNATGNMASSGIYIWTIEFGILGNDDRRKLQGHLTLMR